MRELKPLLITYSRSKATAVDGLRQSLVEREKKILSDITNLPNPNPGPLGRKSINLHSPTATIPSKIRIRDESIHSGFISLPSEADKEFEIFEDELKVSAPEIQPKSVVEVISPLSSDFWSPSRIANDSGLPILPHNKKQRRDARIRQRSSSLPRPSNIEPRQLLGYVWLCSRSLKLKPSNGSDHFDVK